MFKGLALESISPLCDVQFDHEDFIHSLIENSSFDSTDLHEAEELNAAIDNLTAFKSAVEQFGATRSLIAFADHDHTLTQALPLIPALESFETDSAMVLSDEALESIVSTISSTLGRWKDKMKMHFVKWRKWYAGYIKAGLIFRSIGIAMLGIILLLQPAALPLVIPALPKIALFFATDTASLVIIQNMKSVPAAIDEAVKVSLPENEAAFDAYKIKIRQIFMSKAKIDIDNMSESKLDMSDRSNAEGKPTVERLKEIARETATSVSTLKQLNEQIPDRLEKLYEDKAVETKEGRMALSFLTKTISSVLGVTFHNASVATRVTKEIANAVKKAEKKAA